MYGLWSVPIITWKCSYLKFMVQWNKSYPYLFENWELSSWLMISCYSIFSLCIEEYMLSLRIWELKFEILVSDTFLLKSLGHKKIWEVRFEILFIVWLVVSYYEECRYFWSNRKYVIYNYLRMKKWVLRGAIIKKNRKNLGKIPNKTWV